MDQRFPLQASMPPTQQRTTDIQPDLDIVPINSRSASSSPITISEDLLQSLTSHSQSPRPESPSQIAPAVFLSRPYSPQLLSPPDIHQYNNLLPPTIPNLEQPTPVANPLPFQHEYRNQVPIDGEYPSLGAVPAQDDSILPAPPPYSRYAAGAPQKSETERRRPQLEMIDVSAAVRGLPTVHIAVGPNGDVTSSSNSHPPGGSNVAPTEQFALQHSDPGLEISVQSAQSSTFSTNSNRLLMRGAHSEKVKKEKAKDNKRVCGIKLWWILLAIAFVSILLSIVLGVTLGMFLKKNKESQEQQGGGSPSGDSQGPVFPPGVILVPLILVNQSRTCLTNNLKLPGLTGEVERVLWACDIPGRQLQFEIKPNDNSGGGSFPAALPRREGTASEGELVISSMDGGPKPMPIYEGVQPPIFFRQPLYKVLEENGVLESKHFKRGSAGGSPEYEFRLLYTKVIILRAKTIKYLLGNQGYVNGSAMDMGPVSNKIGNGESVWQCKWNKTYIKGRVWMEVADGPSKKRSAGAFEGPSFRMMLHESRPSDQELQQLSSGSNTTDAGRGVITCQEVSNNYGKLVDVNLVKVGNKAKALSEAGPVEQVVRRHFGKGSIFKRGSPESQPTERTDGTGQCLCEWTRDKNTR